MIRWINIVGAQWHGRMHNMVNVDRSGVCRNVNIVQGSITTEPGIIIFPYKQKI